MRRWVFLLTGAVLLSLLPAGSAALQPSALQPVNESQESAQWGAPNVKLVGRNSLFNRGMNAAIAIDRNWAYVGSRTDGTHTDDGVLVLDIANPRNPVVVNRIDRPEQARRGQTSRELRIWPEKDLLLVLNFACSSFIHDCAEEDVTPTIQFYDIRGSKAADPDLIHTYRPAREPHEFYLWDDPANPVEPCCTCRPLTGLTTSSWRTSPAPGKGRFVRRSAAFVSLVRPCTRWR